MVPSWIVPSPARALKPPWLRPNPARLPPGTASRRRTGPRRCELAHRRQGAYSRRGSSCLGRVGLLVAGKATTIALKCYRREGRSVQQIEDCCSPGGSRRPQTRPCGARTWREAGCTGGSARSLAIVYALAATAAATPAAAQGIPLIRDTEVENLLKDYSRPIFKAAGLGSHITMRIVRHDSFNAFVIDGLNVFMNTGTLLQAKTPNEVIGVIAHETATSRAGTWPRCGRDRARPDQGAAAHGAGHRPDGRRRRIGRRYRRARSGGAGRRRHDGRPGNDHAVVAERAARAGVGRRPGRH